MTTAFLSQDIWPQLTKAVRGSRQRCDVAVAYLGAGASRLLPLPKDSRLVVDASKRAVGSGQTCPADLLKLLKRGVAVYSVPNLHAKVFVLGRAAYIGSTNVSSNSAAQLIEAVIRTTEPVAIRSARQFVSDLCLHELTPKALESLAKLYRPPKFPNGNAGKKKIEGTSRHPTLPRLLLAQLEREKWSERDQDFHDVGLSKAKKHRLHPRTFQVDSFQWVGKCPYQKGDVVIQVTDERNGSVLVSPPGNVLPGHTRLDKNGRISFVYVELPSRQRRKVKSLAGALGCTQKRLRTNGLIRERSFARALLAIWALTK